MKWFYGVLFLFIVVIISYGKNQKPDTVVVDYEMPGILTKSLAGNYKGIGFTFEKPSMKLTEADLNIFESSLKIIDKGDSFVDFYVSAELQRRAGMPVKKDKRHDVYQVKWIDETSGKFINTNKKYSGDKGEFIISGKILTVKTWVDRHQAFETQVYEKK